MIEWTAALSTGVELLDEHHKAIFQWVAKLENAAADKHTLLGAYAITRLKNNAEEHFAAEESLMKSAGYPDLAEHMAEHATFRAKLRELHVNSVGKDISADTVRFLRNWLTEHVAKTDMAYVPFLKRQVAQ
ncbi:MAG: bacteriohemerythrin [Rhodocyclales bacterium]|nr:bacteriohemerythrin [Rhodocyclales bacterium]